MKLGRLRRHEVHGQIFVGIVAGVYTRLIVVYDIQLLLTDRYLVKKERVYLHPVLPIMS